MNGRSDGGAVAESNDSDDNPMDNGSSKDIGEDEASSLGDPKNATTIEAGESTEGGQSGSESEAVEGEKEAAAALRGSVKAASAEAALDEQSENKGSMAGPISNAPGQPMPTGDAYLGVRLDASTDAPKIGDIRKNGPADKAGLQVGDVLVAIEGVLITDTAALAKVVNASNVGDKLKVVVSRDREYEKIQVTLGSRSTPNDE